MSKRDLERFLVAARDDPVLAAWTKVVHEYRAEAHAEVSPYEHWEAFQEFFCCGLLSPIEFDSTDVKQTFFSGRNPRPADVQCVLDNLKLLCPEHDLPLEEPMSRAKPPTSAFSNQSAIATRSAGPTGLAAAPSKHELRSRRSGGDLAAFQPRREVMAEPRSPAMVSPFGDESPRPMAAPPPTTLDSKMYVGDMELNGHIVCCGHPLQMVDDGGDIIPPEDMPQGEDFSLLEYMFHCECPNCGSIYHCTVGKPVPRSTY
jgi:hypothetical protein